MGTIKTLTEKGFGFIKRDGESKDLFFHSSELRNVAFNDLRVGDKVEFGIESGEKGLYAADVHLTE